MSTIRRVAIMEPLVDVVEAQSVCSNHALVKVGHMEITWWSHDTRLHDSHVTVLQTIDLYTVTADEVTSFSSPYSLTVSRDDYIDAVVAYFTVQFTKCHKHTAISTGEWERGWREWTVM